MENKIFIEFLFRNLEKSFKMTPQIPYRSFEKPSETSPVLTPYYSYSMYNGYIYALQVIKYLLDLNVGISRNL